MIYLFIISLIPLIISVYDQYFSSIISNEYLYVILFAIEFLVVGIVATSVVIPELTMRQTINNFFVVVVFSVLFSLASVVCADKYLVIDIQSCVLILSIFTLIVSILAIFRKSDSNDNDNLTVDTSSKTTVYLILLLCVLSIIGMTIEPFTNLPLWEGLCIPFIFFLPGYYAINAILPYIDELSTMERSGVAIFTSLIITSIVGLIVFELTGVLDMVITSIIMIILTFIVVVIYMVHVRSIPLNKRYSHRATNNILMAVTIIVLISLVATGIYFTFVGTTTDTSENTLPNATLETSGINKTSDADGYVSFEYGEELTVDMNVTNYDEAGDYVVRVEVVNDTTNRVLNEYPITLGENESQIISTNLTMSSGQKDIRFVLYDAQNQPVVIRHLYANVSE
ncbi:MAG: DUF1616 domain-containing protein [Methanosphaera sp.]|nr:DUF1616 domain-containing protein [Methanosphaera sp.]